MLLQRPDLIGLHPKIREYIESLEAEIVRLRTGSRSETVLEPAETDEFREPPTTINVIVISKSGLIKRTPRHFYTRQRRGGMGVFDLDTPKDDQPQGVLTADLDQYLLLLTDYGRAYPLPVSDLPESEVRSRGQQISDFVALAAGERIVALVPVQTAGHLALLTKVGNVRLLRHNFVGPNIQPGTSLMDVGKLGPLAIAGWIAPNQDVFIATRTGLGIRFGAGKISPVGSLGIRLGANDEVVAVCGAAENEGVLLIGGDGKGTIREMSGFRANKMPGAAGKVALKTDHLAGAISIHENQDVFIISQLSKIIRFQTAEIPPKTGVVQGVNCISLRADEVVAIASSEFP